MSDQEDDSASTVPKTLVDLLTVFAVHLVITTACSLLFSALYTRMKIVYQPKSKYRRDSPKRLPPPITGRFQWIKSMWTLDEGELVSIAGQDALTLMRFLRFTTRLFGLLSIFSVILMAVNALSKLADNTSEFTDDWTQQPGQDAADIVQIRFFAIENVGMGSNFFWIHAAAVYIFAGVTLYYLWGMYNENIILRKSFIQSKAFRHKIHNRTLLFTNLPEDLRDERRLDRMLRNISGIPVRHVQLHVGVDLADLPDLVAEHMKTLVKFEGVLAKYFAALVGKKRDSAQRPTMKSDTVLGCIPAGTRVDAIDHLGVEVNVLEEKIYGKRMHSANFDKSSCAFVLYPTISAAHLALACLKRNRRGLPSPLNRAYSTTCPSPKDLFYDNAGLKTTERFFRTLATSLIIAGLIFGWTIIVSTVALLVKLDQIQQWAPGVANYIATHSFANFFFTSLLPPIVYAVLNIVLIIVLRLVLKFQGFLSSSRLDRRLLVVLFCFNVWNTLIFNGAGVLFEQGKALLEGQPPNYVSPYGPNVSYVDSMLRDVARSFVNNSAFFINLITTSYSGYAIALLNAGALVITYLRKVFVSTTPRALYELTKPNPYDYALIYAALMTPLLVALLFSVTAPLIIPFALMSFMVARVSIKYQLLYMFETKHETGGKYFKQVFHMVLVSLLIFEIVTIFYLRVFAGTAQFYALLPCIVFTIVAWIYLYRSQERRADVLNTLRELEILSDLDLAPNTPGTPLFSPGTPNAAMALNKQGGTKGMLPRTAASSSTTLNVDPWRNYNSPSGSTSSLPNASPWGVGSPLVEASDDGLLDEDDEMSVSSRGGSVPNLAIQEAFVNPAIAAPLERVWVFPWAEHMLPQYFSHTYHDFADYLERHGMSIKSPRNGAAGRDDKHLSYEAIAQRESRLERKQTRVRSRFARIYQEELSENPAPPARADDTWNAGTTPSTYTPPATPRHHGHGNGLFQHLNGYHQPRPQPQPQPQPHLHPQSRPQTPPQWNQGRMQSHHGAYAPAAEP